MRSSNLDKVYVLHLILIAYYCGRGGTEIMSSAARSDLKMNTFLSSIFEYLRKLIRNARRCINSKIEGAKMIHTLLRSSIDEIDTQIWLAERLGLVDVNELTGFFAVRVCLIR